MSEARKATSATEMLAAQRTIPVEMRDKSGNKWAFELSPVCARTLDAQDRFHPLPMPKQAKDEQGKPAVNPDGSPMMDVDNDEFRSRWLEASKARVKAHVAAAMPPAFFGNKISIVQQVETLENLFDYAEIRKASDLVTADSIASKQDIAEARQDVDPFASTQESGPTEA